MSPTCDGYRKLFIAIGGVWFNRFYGGFVNEEGGSTYRISLLTTFGIDKWWSFAPNTEMYPGLNQNEVPENPPAEFSFAEFLGIPEWVPRPSWIPNLYLTGHNAWSVFIPDEWAHSLETEGTAKSFWLHGLWARNEEFVAVDLDCNGWSVDEIVQGPVITRELLPTCLDPSTNSALEWINYSK